MIRNYLFSLLITLVVSSQGWAGDKPTFDSLLVAKGDSFMAQYDYYHALLCYLQVPDVDAEVKRKLAKCYFLRADYRRCVVLLEQLPDSMLDHDALRQLFYSYKALDDKTPKQRQWGERLLQRYPMDSEVVADMALACNLNDVPEDALRLTQCYEDVDATNILVKRQKADAQFFLKQYPEATATYEQLIALGDSTFNVHYSLGMCYEQLANLDSTLLAKAIDHYGKAVALNDSAKAWPLYHLGAALVKAQRNSEGIHVLLMALQRMQPDDAAMFNLHSALADGYYQNGEYYSAIWDWKNCLKYNNRSLASLYNIAQTYELIEDDGMKAEQAYIEFLLVAESADRTTPALEEWKRHAEAFGHVHERMEQKRAEYGRIMHKLKEMGNK